MKIMFVVLSLGKGGAERVVSVLANSFSQLCHDVVIVLSANSKICYPISDKVKTICLENEWSQKQKAFFRVLHRIRAIRKTVESENPDIVISFLTPVNMETAVALMNKHTPLIVSERSNPAIVPAGRLKKMLRHIIYFRPNGFVFQTEGAQNYFSRFVQDKSEIIMNPLVSSLPEYFAGKRRKRIVSVGRLVKAKNYPLLLDAFEAFHKVKPEYCLEIYGEGELETVLKEKIIKKKLDDCVNLMGFCDDVHAKINDASIFVMSSDYEGMPNALIEAMAQGIPCISTDCPCGGPRTLIENGKNGLLIKTGDVAGLTKAMIEILDNPSYEDIGEKAREIQSKVNIQSITKQWLDFIEKVKDRGYHG